MDSINPRLNWKLVTKGRRSRTSVARRKLSAVVSGQATSGKTEQVPTNKRSHLLRSPSPQPRTPSICSQDSSSQPYSSSPIFEDNDAYSSHFSVLRSESSYSNWKLRDGSATIKFGKEFDYDVLSKQAGGEHNYVGDFSGLELLAAAASLDEDVDKACKEDLVVQDSLISKSSDISNLAAEQIPSVQTPSAAPICPAPSSSSASAQLTRDVSSLLPSSTSSPSARNIIKEAVNASLLQIQEYVAKKGRVFDTWMHYRLKVRFEDMISKLDVLIRMENDILQFTETSYIPAAMQRKELYMAMHTVDRFAAIINAKICTQHTREDAYIIIDLQSRQMTVQAETNLLRDRFGLIDLGFACEPQPQVTEPAQKYVVRTSSQTDPSLADAALDQLIEEIISEPADGRSNRCSL